jgi:hypothetical protein
MFQSVVDFLADNTAIVALIVGALTPLLTSVAQQPGMSSRKRGIIAGAISVIVGFIVAASTGNIDNPADLAAVVTIVLASAEAFYQKVWGNVTVWIEEATSPTAAAPADPTV